MNTENEPVDPKTSGAEQKPQATSRPTKASSRSAKKPTAKTTAAKKPVKKAVAKPKTVAATKSASTKKSTSAKPATKALETKAATKRTRNATPRKPSAKAVRLDTMVTLHVGGRNLEFSLDEAEQLYKELGILFKKVQP